MEAVKSRSESPFSRSKAKSHLSSTAENGSMVIEQIKAKKKGLKNKCKSQQNGKENENIANNGKDYFEGEKSNLSEMGEPTDSINTEIENGINNGGNIESRNGTEEVEEQTEEHKENDALINVCDTAEECSNESSTEITENETTDELKSTENLAPANTEDESSIQNSSSKTLETESCTKKDNLLSSESLPDSNTACENIEEKSTEEPNDTFNKNFDVTQELEATAEGSDIKETSQISVNGSDVNSPNEPTNVIEDHIQASPDTATKDENSFSNKITNFFGKLSYSCEKQDSEVSSSKKVEGALNHPYLSKVSGRRGIKDRLNSSATVFSSREMEVKTPENSGISLDDSFRVRTNPPRLNSLDLQENPTLRKFKGKRCLNAGDEPEEEDDIYLNMMKRRKVDEKTHEPGLWGSILLKSPFKKKSFDDDDDHLKLATNESKLSRLLSPFWFWKKTAAGQKGK